MRPVKLFLRGEFWDSQIYSGELILFGADGALHRLNWAAVVDQLASQHSSIQTALRVAFSDGDLFYTQKVQRILRDPAIESVIKKQLVDLASLSISADRSVWGQHWRTGDTPFNFLPTDTDVYYNRLFAAGDDGLFSAPRGTQSSTFRKHHDGRVLQVKASDQNTAVAAAGGVDGLFEFAYESQNEKVLDRRRRVANIPCSAFDWAFQSIVGWNDESLFFASYREDRDPHSKKKVRTFDQLIRQEQILASQDLVTHGPTRFWGSHEKLFCVSSEGLEVLNYTPPSSGPRAEKSGVRQRARFSRRGKLAVEFDLNDVISTGTAPFGAVLEFADRVVVLRSDGGVDVFDGEAVHWRVFPRSEHYNNQLHIIYEDSLLIVSFLHDYFLEQTTKLMGFARGSNDYARLEDVGGY